MSTIAATLATLAQMTFPVMVIGGVAMQAYGLARPTFDVDCMIASTEKARLRARLEAAGFCWMAEFGAFEEYRFGGAMDAPPLHSMAVEAATFEKMWAQAQPFSDGASDYHVPALPHLIALKFHAAKNRPERSPKDLRDVVELLGQNPGRVRSDELREIANRYASEETVRQLETLRIL